MLLAASSTPWPIIVVWVVAVLLAKLAKTQKTPPPRRPLELPGPAKQARSEMGDTLQRAMEKLKQAEREAKAGRTGGQALRRTTQPTPVRPSVRLVFEEAAPVAVAPDAPAATVAADSAALQPIRPSAPLAHFADGSLRSAIILAEILGRPVSSR